MSASPLSLRPTRVNLGVPDGRLSTLPVVATSTLPGLPLLGGGADRGAVGRFLRRGLAHGEAREAGHGDVLAELGDGLLDQLVDLLPALLVADPGLVEQADLGVERLQLALDDLVL